MSANSPDVVGLSVMTFQRKTARKVIALVRALRPKARIVVGGYDPSLAPEEYEDPTLGIDFIVRGEGDLTFRELMRAIERGGDCGESRGCTGDAATVRAQSATRRESSRRRRSAAEARGARAQRLHAARPADRHRRDVARLHVRLQLLLDHRDARPQLPHVVDRARRRGHPRRARRGARAIFLVDDNITLNIARFKALCQAIIDTNLNDIDYIVQGMTSAIASAGDELAR